MRLHHSQENQSSNILVCIGFKTRYQGPILVFKVSKFLHLFFFRFPPQFSQLLDVDPLRLKTGRLFPPWFLRKEKLTIDLPPGLSKMPKAPDALPDF